MQETPTSEGFARRVLAWLVAFLALSAAYLYTFPQPNSFYGGVGLVHAFGGVVVGMLLVPWLFRLLRAGTVSSRAGWLLIAAGAVLGLILLKTGTPRTE